MYQRGTDVSAGDGCISCGHLYQRTASQSQRVAGAAILARKGDFGSGSGRARDVVGLLSGPGVTYPKSRPFRMLSRSRRIWCRACMSSRARRSLLESAGVGLAPATAAGQPPQRRVPLRRRRRRWRARSVKARHGVGAESVRARMLLGPPVTDHPRLGVRSRRLGRVSTVW
jgi:hypothetical protein